MAPSLSLLSAADLGSVPLDLCSGLLESTGGSERCDLNWSTLTRVGARIKHAHICECSLSLSGSMGQGLLALFPVRSRSREARLSSAAPR